MSLSEILGKIENSYTTYLHHKIIDLAWLDMHFSHFKSILANLDNFNKVFS